ncbi:MAG TPA: arginine--tRNA ligase [Gammaproteobacteria bacterium]|nr:arginine--tRNA ligase [Gammaproteobacteria bacterium]
MQQKLEQIVRSALRSLADRDGPAELAALDPGIERARDPAHGDFASNVAMRAAKLAGLKPRELAEAIVAAMPSDPIVAAIDIAGPGFINFRLATSAFHESLREILQSRSGYGRAKPGSRGRALVEYLSANPTGPLHVGHGRIAAYGASLAALLCAYGYEVDEEYYINDAGRQMDILATSVWLRYAQRHGVPLSFPANCYQGDYVGEIAGRLAAEHGDSFLGGADSVVSVMAGFGDNEEQNLDALIAALKAALSDAHFSTVLDATLNEILADIRNDLEEFGASPGRWFSERSLLESGAVAAALEALEQKGLLYEKDGPTWFRTTRFGDDKDRVVVRENGVSTYFASDIAYHVEKYGRGYDLMINVFGADHHGYTARVLAGVAATEHDTERLEFRLVQFVVLYRGDQKVKMTTRGASYITLRELREEIGSDAARFFYVSRSNDQHLDFDLELAKAQTSDNPVYYVQYAHARVASMLARLEGSLPDTTTVDFGRLSADAELSLMRSLGRYPEIVELAATGRAPQHIVHYLRDLAAAFHAYYNAHRILIDDDPLRDARVLLAVATREVIRNGLDLLGVSAPEEM